jgi:hypothetical protein
VCIKRRCRQSAFDSPSGAQSITQRGSLQPDPLRPIGKAKRDVVVGDESRSSRIATLLRHCGPSDVSWFVVPVSIRVSVESVCSRWTRTHIGQKLSEVIPHFADKNTASSVSCEAVVMGISTTVAHRLPSAIFCRILRICSSAVFRQPRDGGFAHQTTTTPSVRGNQRAPHHDRLIAAFTSAPPPLTSIWFKDDQSGEHESCEVWRILSDSHATSSESGVVAVRGCGSHQRSTAPLIMSRVDIA